MNEKLEDLEEIVESVESAEKIPQKILLVGTHQGASLVMANLAKDIRASIKEVVGKFSERPQRSYPKKAKKGRSRS
jgi:ribosomal protein S2